MAHTEFQKGEFRISTNPGELDINVIHSFLKKSYWAENIPRETVEKSIAGSICFGLYHQERQIGFARVVTDKATFAYIADVFVEEEFRGQGLAKWLMKEIVSYKELTGLRRWMLGTKDAHGLYSQVGFTPLSQPERFMQILKPDIYKQ